MDVEAKSKQLKTYFEEAEKTLDSLSFDVESYGSSGWNVFLSVVVGAGAAGAAGLGKKTSSTMIRVFLVSQEVNYISWGCNKALKFRW